MKLRLSIFVMFAIAAASVAARAEDRFCLWFKPEATDFKLLADSEVAYFFEEDVENDDASEFQYTQYEFSAAVPVFRNERNEVFAQLDVRSLDIDTDVRLPRNDRNDPFPSQLTDLSLGVTARHFCTNGWLVGANLKFGSASDKLFNSEDEITYSATAFLRIPSGEHNAWIFYLNESNARANGNLNNAPLPGFGYQFALNEKSWAVVGVPFVGVHYEPNQSLELDAQYMMMRTVHSKLTWHATDKLDLFGAFDWESQLYYRHDRKDSEDGLFFFDKKLTAGVDWNVNDNIKVGAFGGYAFGRFIYEAEKYDQRDKNRIDIDDGAFGGLNISIEF